MGFLFASAFHDEFGTWPLAYVPYGGADVGEIAAVAKAVGDGDDAAFHGAWVAAGDRLAAEATERLAAGRGASARELWLRASCHYMTSLHPLYGDPVDPRLVAAFRKGTAALEQGLLLDAAPATRLAIPFEDGAMPGWLVPAAGRAAETRPLLILTNGYDGTMTDLYCASAVAASRRGYHCLLFDGPGQGAMLVERGMRLRPDWETVVRAVVDVAVTLPGVDPARIALYGWSLGGYLAPRAASGEPRLAACVADPGLWSVAEGFRAAVVALGATPAAARHLAGVAQEVLDRFMAMVEGDRRLRWTIVQRGFWVHGLTSLRDYLAAVETFTLDGRTERIRCPTLLTVGEDDRLGASAPALYAALRGPRELLRFTAAEGAGDHCEMRNRSLLNRRVLDWLDGVLGA
ncbi:MAG: alpha/beta fold hydrolase [bacterium]|nr:alpha/beta fold hydrolase [bacterium]